MDILKQYIEEAMTYQLPVVLHAVHDKVNIVYSLLQDLGVEHAHFHWLKAPENVLKRIISAGYYVSVTPEVCYKIRDQTLAQMVPLDQLLIETDGPWMFEGEFKGKQTTLNAIRCYKITDE